MVVAVETIPFRANLRAAAVSLITDYAADRRLKMQVYPAHPRTILPPTAFVESIREAIGPYTNVIYAPRRPLVDIVVLHGVFDSQDAVDQADAFVDGFYAWVLPRFHAAGPNTLAQVSTIEDDPVFVADWLPEVERRLTYYATRITLEGYAAG